MYKLHLIRKYLFKRRIAWVSLAAVMMCVAMVLVVISVMGGWLKMFKESFHGLSGDVIVEGTLMSGFPNYQEMIDRIEKLPTVEAAVPLIKTFGVINIDNQQSSGVQVIGYPIERIGLVNDFPKSLYQQYQQFLDQAEEKGKTKQDREALRKQAEAGAKNASFKLPLPPEVYRSRFPNAARDDKGNLVNDPATEWPGMIVGSGVIDIRKDKHGKIVGREQFKYRLPVYMTLPRIGVDQKPDQTATASRNYWIVDDSRTKLWQYDSSTVYVPFDVLQKDLDMGAKRYKNKRTGEWETEPARASEINVKVKPGVDLQVAKAEILNVVREVQGLPPDMDIEASLENVQVQTWLESQAIYIGAIENEISLVTTLFGMISIVAIFLIFCIFYMIVVEKTRDIGIIKSVGATSTGVAAIFLGYGAAIGLVGGMLGLLLGSIVVWNINEIHGFLGRFGIVIWKPEVYAFDIIPNIVEPRNAVVIAAIAILSSVIGALVPAIRAARLNPVEALRWE